jgi:flagellar protein FliO/FliZ
MMELVHPESPISVNSLTQLMTSLMVIVALIFATGWVLKRNRFAAARSRGDMSILDELAVGPRDRVVLIRVGEAQLLVGVGTNGIVPLAPLTMPISLKATSAAPAFADRLRDLLRRDRSE